MGLANMAFISRRIQVKKPVWRIVWQDKRKGDGRAGRREADCLKGDHADALEALKKEKYQHEAVPKAITQLINGATTQRQRNQLLLAYEALERQSNQQAIEARLEEVRFELEAGLVDLMKGHLASLREKQRKPGDGKRGTKAKKTNDAYALAFGYFRQYLNEKSLGSMTCGSLQPRHLTEFADWLETVEGRKTKQQLSDATYNQVIRSLKAFLRAVGSELNGVRYFRRPLPVLLSSFRTRATGDMKEPRHFSAAEIQRLLKRAWDLDHETVLEVKRSKKKLNNQERFQMATERTAIFPWLVLLLLTGARPHELADLRWRDFDAERGMLILTSTKLKRRRSAKGRRLVLNDVRWPISPILIQLLKAWGEGANSEDFILEADPRMKTRAVPRRAWRRLAEGTEPRIRAYDARASWVTWMVGQGHPQPIVALLAGHRPDVQSEHYLTLPVDANQAPDLETAMGVTDILRKALEEAVKNREKT